MCSYIDILAPDSYVSVNKKFIKMVGLTTATYFSLLLDILKEVRNKKTYDPETGYFTLQRAYVTNEINLPTDEQHNCDDILIRLGILQVETGNRNRIAIDVKKFTTLLVDDTSDPQNLLPKTVKMTRAEKKSAKDGGIKNSLVRLFEESDPDVIAALTDLVDVYYVKGYVKAAQWKCVKDLINQTVSTDADKVKLIKSVIGCGWQSISGAIDKFKETYIASGTRLNKTQTSVKSVNKEIKF